MIRIRNVTQPLLWLFFHSILALICSYVLFPVNAIPIPARIAFCLPIILFVAFPLTWLTLHPAFRYFPAQLRSGRNPKYRKPSVEEIEKWVPKWEADLNSNRKNAVLEDFRIKSANYLWVLRQIRETAEGSGCLGVVRLVDQHPFFNTSACYFWLTVHSVLIVAILVGLKVTGHIQVLASWPTYFLILLLLISFTLTLGPFQAQVIEARLKGTNKVISQVKKMISFLSGDSQ